MCFQGMRVSSQFSALQELCKKPCGVRGSCSFALNDTAFCKCDYGWSGEFCGKMIDVPFRRVFGTGGPRAAEETFACDRTTKPKTLFCDGHFDCDDKSDENNCTSADYRTAKPHVDERFRCLMPCRWGKCEFDSLPPHKAQCLCHDKAKGEFCEHLVQTTTEQIPTSTVQSPTPIARVPPSATILISIQSPGGRQKESTKKSSNFVKIIVLPVLAICGVAVILWLVM